MKYRAAALLTALSLLCGGMTAMAADEATEPATAATEAAKATEAVTEAATEASEPATDATEAATEAAADATEAPTEPATEAPTEPVQTSPITVICRSQEDIKSYIAGHAVDRNAVPAFESEPVYTAPYATGSLDADSLQNALNALNIVRYVAGVEEVSLSELYLNRTQGAALLFAVNGKPDHASPQPAGMSDALYDICKRGAASSNISKGYTNPAAALLNGYMPGTTSSVLAQRRCCLDPRMLETGFGFAQGNDAMYIYDTQHKTDIRGVSWPAQNMPTELFSAGAAWSISMGTKVEGDITVTLTRQKDGKVWHFSTADKTLTVDNVAYGQVGCLIFKPGDVTAYADGDSFRVEIGGLETPVSYSVDFFDSGLYNYEQEQNNPGIRVQSRTPEQIMAYMKAHPVSRTLVPAYAVQPGYEMPYALGRLDAVSALNALNALNTARYIAGLDAVQLNTELSDYAQGAVLVNAINNTLSHTLTQPEGMSNDLFAFCQTGATSSNISYSYENPAAAVLNGFLPDTASAVLSHRRWCLNPAMEKTGFGFAEKRSGMYAYDRGGKANYYGVCWPARNMPTELFSADTAWSISMGAEVNAEAVTVTLTRMRDGRVWRFGKSYADGTFSVDNAGYGQKGCIMFKPEGVESYAAGDSFIVSVTGLDNPVKYDVNFFDSGFADAVPVLSSLGDLNGDKNVDASDAARILMASAAVGVGKPSGLTAAQETAADVTRDGKIDAMDAAAVLRYAAAAGIGNVGNIEDFV